MQSIIKLNLQLSRFIHEYIKSVNNYIFKRGLETYKYNYNVTLLPYINVNIKLITNSKFIHNENEKEIENNYKHLH